MAGKSYRIGVVGASSLVGKELADALADSALAGSDLVLLDDEEAGQMTAAGDEASFIQRIEPESFAGMDFVFFTGDAEVTRKYWKTARSNGASIVDMTYALESEPGVVVRAPWVGAFAEGSEDPRAQEPGLTTVAVVPAHPAVLMLLVVVGRLLTRFALRGLSATVFEPASEHGRQAMDELHQQTVSLLSFRAVPREQFGAQVAFSLLPSLGDGAKVNLTATAKRIMEQYAALSPVRAPKPALQLVQAPVFHGYVVSMLVELERAATVEQIELALYGEHVDLVGPESDPPSNVSATGQDEILARIGPARPGEGSASQAWVWLAADNLKLAALNAIACAVELGRLRPQGKVQ